MTGRGLVDTLLSTLLAPPCAACGRILDRPLDGPVCATCWSRITFISPPICDGCGDPLPSWRIASCNAGVCARCRRLRPAVDRMRAIGPYQGELRAIVHALKYDGRRTIARKLGELMRMGGRDILAGADAIVPVPLHPRRRRQRGFNQAALLGSHLGLPMHEMLRRIIHTQPQVELPAARRHRNVREAFQVIGGGADIAGGADVTGGADITGGAKAPPLRRGWEHARARLVPVEAGLQPRLPGPTLVLVDDVITTGATLDACARVLKAAGAREVRALTAARVVSGPPRAPGP